MSASIDERAAWELVRAVAPGRNGPPVRVRLDAPPDARSDLWLDVDGAGVWTASGVVTDAARDLFDIYLPLRVQQDLVIGQLGQSLDGRIATESGASHFVTGPEDIVRLHRLRALVDAVLVGASTVASDDPRLTVREVEGENPVRVVLDSDGRLDPGRRVFTDGAARTVVVRRSSAAPMGSEGRTEVISVPATESGDLDLASLLRILSDQGLARILVEGGGVTVSRFLQAGLLDRLHITVAPLLIGSGRPSITLDPVATLDEALRPGCRHFHLGRDVLFDLDLRSGSA